jgi:hypothetical protein
MCSFAEYEVPLVLGVGGWGESPWGTLCLDKEIQCEQPTVKRAQASCPYVWDVWPDGGESFNTLDTLP